MSAAVGILKEPVSPIRVEGHKSFVNNQKNTSNTSKSRWGRVIVFVASAVVLLCCLQFFDLPRSSDPVKRAMRRPARFIRNGTQRIAVLTTLKNTEGVYSWMWPMSYHSKKEYCTRHGYDLIVGGPNDIEEARSSHWSKLTMMLKWLPHYDYILWQDVDSFFTNYDIRLESVIPEGKDMVMSRDYNNINSGVFILKNSKWSFDFVHECLNVPLDQLVDPLWHDQAAMIKVLGEKPQYWEHIYSPPQRSFNAYPKANTWYWAWSALWHPGDFICHAPNCPNVEGCRENFEEIYEFSARQGKLPPANPKPPLQVYPMEIPSTPPYWGKPKSSS